MPSRDNVTLPPPQEAVRKVCFLDSHGDVVRDRPFSVCNSARSKSLYTSPSSLDLSNLHRLQGSIFYVPMRRLQSDHPAELFAQAQVAKTINKDTMILRIICGEGEFFIFRDDERDFDNVHGSIITTGAVDISITNGE